MQEGKFDIIHQAMANAPDSCHLADPGDPDVAGLGVRILIRIPLALLS
jgi:hypothetical protein